MELPPTTPPDPPVEDPRELTTAMFALQCKTTPGALQTSTEKSKKAAKKSAKKTPKQNLKTSKPASPPNPGKTHSDHRAMLALGLFVLLLGGILQLATSAQTTRSGPNNASRADIVFGNALTGTCLGWLPNASDKPSFVQCSENHMFEVARPVSNQNLTESCPQAVRDYLGPRFDPNSRFTSVELSAGDGQKVDSDGQSMLCGLQLPGPDGQPIPFKGKVGEQDQSKVWPVGTCLGIDPGNGRSTEVPVPCAAPHAVEVTGTVNLGEQFPDARPAEPEQDRFARDACTRAADEYLAPVPLEVTGLSVNFPYVSPESWSAGGRQVPCTIGISRGDGSWTPLLSSAKVGVVIGDQAPPPPPPLSPEPEATEAPPEELPTPIVEATEIPTPTPTPTPTPPSGPPPGPAEPLPEPGPTEPPANVINIGGTPFTLPWAASPAEPPPP